MQLIILAMSGAVDQPLASCMLVHFLEIKFEVIVGVYVWHNGEQLFIAIDYVLHISWCLTIL